jgi:predicted permease
MRPGRKLWRRLRDAVRRRRDEARMAEEMRQHLEHRIAQNLRQGMDRHAARRAAETAFGRADSIKEEIRDLRDSLGLESLRRDLAFSFRSLRRSPLLSLGAILTVALCLGANVTAFSALYGLVLKPPSLARSGELVEIYTTAPPPEKPKEWISIHQYLEFKRQADRFENFAFYREQSDTLGKEESDPQSEPIRIADAWTTADYFDVLRVQPLLGRFYGEPEQLPGKGNVVVLTQSFWESRYHADPQVVGKIIDLTGVPCEVIGVAPRTVENVNRLALLFRPMNWAPNLALPETHRYAAGSSAMLYARIKPGIAREDALAQLNALERQFYATLAPPPMRAYVERNQIKIALGTIRTEQSRSIGPGLALLQGAAVVVLLLGCLHIAGLMLARLNARRIELAIRRALGAGVGTLIRQLVIENVLLVGSGTVLSLGIAWGGLRLINRSTNLIVPQTPPISLDGVILTVTLLASLVVVFLAVFLPAMLLHRSRRHSPVQGGAPDSLPGDGLFRLNRLLATGHVALTLLLLVGAGFLVRDLIRTNARNADLDATHLIHVRIAFSKQVRDFAPNHAVADELVRRFREIPGVTAVAMASAVPTNESTPRIALSLQGATLAPEESAPLTTFLGVSPDFFATTGQRIVEGRNFTAEDNLPGAPPSMVVDRNFAERYFPGRSAVGARQPLGRYGRPENQAVVIGVVEPASFQGPNDRRGLPFVFVRLAPMSFNGFSVVIRTSRSLQELTPLLQEVVRSVDPTLPLYNLKTLQTIFDEATDYQRGVTVFLGTLGLVSLLLAAVGLSVGFACEVSRRTGEIGIRRALGASQRQILASLLRQVFQKIALGLPLGLAAFLAARRWLGDQFFAPSSSDPSVYLLVSALLLLVIMGVIYLPARRASQIDPVTALRRE